MNYILPLIIGFLSSFLGLLAPSMLNMTAAKTSIERGTKAGIEFAAGAASIIFLQGFIAVTFAKYLIANPTIILKLKIAAIFILFGLAVFFYLKARKEFKIKGRQKTGSNFLNGLVMSSLNMLAIPFYLTMATWAEGKSWMQIEYPFSLMYVGGAVFGAFSLFAIYATFSQVITRKAQFIARNINYILSVLFIVLAISVALQVLT